MFDARTYLECVLREKKPGNLIHIVINNEAHKTAGGAPTVSAEQNKIAFMKFTERK